MKGMLETPIFEHPLHPVLLSLALLEAAVAWLCIALLKRIEPRSLAGYITSFVLFLFAAGMPWVQAVVARQMMGSNPINDKVFLFLWAAEGAFLVRIVYTYGDKYLKRQKTGGG
jgi:hypothetical protein